MDEQQKAGKPILQQPPTRREALLFGLLILAAVWFMLSQHPIRVISVPDVTSSATRLVEAPHDPVSRPA